MIKRILLAAISTFATGTILAQAPDLTIGRIEVVQTIQDDAQSVPLVAGKATGVRVFIKQQVRLEPLIANVTAVLRGIRDGVEIPLSPLRPVNPAITAQVSPDRNNAAHSQDFILPLAWTQAGQLELRAELRVPAGILELPTDNNIVSRQVEFVDAPLDPRMAWLPLCGADGRCATGALGYQRLVQRMFPLADGSLRYDDVPVAAARWSGALDTTAGSSALTAWVEKWRLLLQGSPLAPQVLAAWLPKATNALQPSGGNGRSVWVVEQADSASSEQALAMQLAPASTGDPCANRIQDPGYDPLTARLVPSTRVEFNSFCAGGKDGIWTSAPLARALAANHPFTTRSMGTDSGLLIGGVIGTDGTGTLDNAYSAPAAIPVTATAAGPTTIRVTTSTGTQDYSYAVGAGSSFTLVVPASGTIQSVALLSNGAELARLTASGTAPAVTLTPPVAGQNIIRWAASDAGNRALTYLLAYSNDGGSSWIPLGVDLRETQLAIDPALMLQGSLQFRLQASAGLDTAVVTSDPVAFAADPVMAPTAITLDFGSLTTGTLAERNLVIRNSGNAPLILQNFASTDTFPLAAPSPFQVRAGTERQYPARAFPLFSGPDAATLSADTNDPANPALSVTLKDAVYDRPVPNIGISVSSLDFGKVQVGQTKDIAFSLRNDGALALNITNLSTLNARFSVVSPVGAFALQPGEERVVTARFSPNAGGVQSGSLSIASNDPSTPTVRMDVRGEGITSTTPAIEVSALSIDFGTTTVGQTSPRTLTVRNTGNGTLSVDSLSIDATSFRLVSPVPPVTLAPGGQQIVSLQFAPSAAGSQTGTLVIASNDPVRPRVTVPLTGLGQTAPPAPAPHITSLVPASLQVGELRFDLTVNGSNFTTASKITWNGVERPTVFVNNTLVRASVAPEDVARAATVTVGVTNPAPGGPSNTLPFIVNPEGAGAQIVNVDLTACPTVTSTVNVYDRVQLPITALNGGNLNCTDDSAPTPCAPFTVTSAGSRLSIVMVLHGSADAADPALQQVALVDQWRTSTAVVGALGDTDRAAVIRVDNGLRTLVDFTEGTDRQALTDAIADPLRRFPNGTGTALYDGMNDAVRRLGSQTGRRKAIILFSAAKNTYPTAITDDQLSRTLQTSGIPVYTFPIGTGTSSPDVVSLLHQIAIDSSGQFLSDPSVDQVTAATKLMSVLSAQSLVQYVTPNRDGAPHLARINFTVPGAAFTAARFYPGCPAR